MDCVAFKKSDIIAEYGMMTTLRKASSVVGDNANNGGEKSDTIAEYRMMMTRRKALSVVGDNTNNGGGISRDDNAPKGIFSCW